MRLLSCVLCLTVVLSAAGWCDEGHHHAPTEQELGSVHFANSCSKAVQTTFSRAVALLHSFQYEQSRNVFEEISRRDPNCAMAQWGIAMSHYHGLWDNGDMAAGREALGKAQAVAAASPRTTAREKAYIDALAEIYRDDDKDKSAHANAFEAKMRALQQAYPRDSEAAIFHALSLAITAPNTDKTFAHQRECGEILEPIFQAQPHHPGVAHYLIHCYDNPVLAEKGVAVARVYARIAPASAHANHMPSHIFTRVGSWEESISSNLRSEDLAARDEASSHGAEARDQRVHAMDYLEYAYLQSGRVAKAKSVVEDLAKLPPIAGMTLTGDYGSAAIPARYTLELGQWEQASRLQANTAEVPWAQAITWTAVGIGSARSHNLERAGKAEQTLAGLREQTAEQNNTYWANQVEVQRREVAAWIAEENGKSDDGIAIMRSAAELEDSMEKEAVTPGAVLPAREMLAELLLSSKQPQESLAEYQAVLRVAPNRFNALYGAGRAAEAAGDAATAALYFGKLQQVAAGNERPELDAVRRKSVAVTGDGSTSKR